MLALLPIAWVTLAELLSMLLPLLLFQTQRISVLASDQAGSNSSSAPHQLYDVE